MGDKVRIRLVSANLTRRQLDYEWIVAAGASGDAEETTQVKGKKKKG
jgi:ribonuclease R